MSGEQTTLPSLQSAESAGPELHQENGDGGVTTLLAMRYKPAYLASSKNEHDIEKSRPRVEEHSSAVEVIVLRRDAAFQQFSALTGPSLHKPPGLSAAILRASTGST